MEPTIVGVQETGTAELCQGENVRIVRPASPGCAQVFGTLIYGTNLR